MKKKRVGTEGGNARAKALSSTKKSEIASKAATERWAKSAKLPKETHSGTLAFAHGIECSVLSNNMRVISGNGLERAFGSKSKGGSSSSGLPAVLSAANLQPFIGSELQARLEQPVAFKGMHGGRISKGYEAELLSKICEVLLSARAAGALRKSQLHLASAAELMMRGFALVGIVALIDEATGYQAERARDELHRILEQYISKELLPWTKKFPDEFFEQIYRVHGWKYDAENSQRPGYVGKFINRYVYEQLPDGVLGRLREKNPPVNGRRKVRHHQMLTEHTGDPHLDRQIVATTTAMKLSSDKDDFKAKFSKLYPPRDGQSDIDIDDDDSVRPALADVSGARGLTLSYLADGHTKATKDIATAVHKSSGPSVLNTMRQFLNRLKKEGLVESPSPGLWRRAHSPARGSRKS